MKNRLVILITIVVIMEIFSIATYIIAADSEHSPGIKLIHNDSTAGLASKGRKVDYRSEVTIGEEDRDEMLMFHSPMDVTVDKYQNIYVLDSGKGKVQKFDKDGNFLLTIGNKGEGPGEMMRVWDIELDSKGNIWTFDIGLNRISKFDSSGQFILSFKVKMPPYKGVLDSDNNIYMYGMHGGKLIHKFSSRGERILSFMDYVKCDNRRTRSHLNSMGGLAIDGDDRIYLALIYPYTINVFNKNGRMIKKIITKSDYAVPPYIGPNNVVVVNFQIIGLHISSKGNIFCRSIFFEISKPFDINRVLSSYKSRYLDHSYIDVFDSDGNHIIHQKAKGFGNGGCFDSKDRYYGIEETEECIRVARFSVEY
jgi:hypothetical protein